ncbi:hypothetical protein D1872_311840 [compost metagenome]
MTGRHDLLLVGDPNNFPSNISDGFYSIQAPLPLRYILISARGNQRLLDIFPLQPHVHKLLLRMIDDIACTLINNVDVATLTQAYTTTELVDLLEVDIYQ